MIRDPLTPEEDALLTMLEGQQPVDRARFDGLFEALMRRHWHALVVYIGKRYFDESISAEDIALHTFAKAYDILQQQLEPYGHTPAEKRSLIYSREHCPQFVGFVKALARWRQVDAVRQAVRYRTALHRLRCHTQQRARQYGIRHTRHGGAPVPLPGLESVPPYAKPIALWDYVRQLPSREHLLVLLYFQHGPEALDLPGLVALARRTGLRAEAVRALQRRCRAWLRGRRTTTLSQVTQDDLAVLFDVDRETIRRLLTKARQRLREAFAAEGIGCESA